MQYSPKSLDFMEQNKPLFKIDPSGLAEFIRSEVRSELERITAEQSENGTSPNEWMTVKEVAKELKVSIQTVWNHTKKGILTKYKIQGRTLYKRSEVMEAIQRMEPRRR